ncbi:MAG: RHS repeat-associated core domain-containing protein [candidate division Zixibacteria bacterium]|nr:RHS repeat-associated core domain-containing protein [candidate division Zixibacteria bacterium]
MSRISVISAACLVIILLVFGSTLHSANSADKSTTSVSLQFTEPQSNRTGENTAGNTNGSLEGINNDIVNLYTGQHEELFNIVNVACRGGLNIDVSLDYVSFHLIECNTPNYIKQTSPFGLGFSLNSSSIIAKHNHTVQITDDEYRLIIGRKTTNLYRLDDNVYVPQDGAPWQAIRNTAVINGITMVTGWMIKQIDGTVYRYGDFSPDGSELGNLNATRTVLRFGDYVGSGTTNIDEKYPIQWDLKLVHDPDSLNWYEYTYTQDSAYLQVMDVSEGGNNNVVNTNHAYTQAAYIESIETVDGTRIVFTHSNRMDKSNYFGVNLYSFQMQRKYDTCKVLDIKNEVVECVAFNFSNLGKDVHLKSIVYNAHNEDQHTTKFYYGDVTHGDVVAWPSFYNNPDYYIGRIDYMNGHSRIFKYRDPYRSYGDNSNRNNQKYLRVDSMYDQIIISTSDEGSVVTGENMIISALGGQTRFYRWDSYWRNEGSYDTDACFSSNGTWIARRFGTHGVEISNFGNGYNNKFEIWPDCFSNWRSGSNVNLFSGDENSFVAVLSYGLSSVIKKAAYFYWDGIQWKYCEIYSVGNISDPNTFHRVTGVHVKGSIVAITAYDDNGDGYVYRGIYDPTSNSMTGDRYTIPNYIFTQDRCIVGDNYVAFNGANSITCYYWNEDKWNIDNIYMPVAYDKIDVFVPMSNGFVWLCHKLDNGNEYDSRINTAFVTPQGLHHVDPLNVSTSSQFVDDIKVTDHSLLAFYNSQTLKVYEWAGNSWEYNHTQQSAESPFRSGLITNSFSRRGFYWYHYLGNSLWQTDANSWYHYTNYKDCNGNNNYFVYVDPSETSCDNTPAFKVVRYHGDHYSAWTKFSRCLSSGGNTQLTYDDVAVYGSGSSTYLTQVRWNSHNTHYGFSGKSRVNGCSKMLHSGYHYDYYGPSIERLARTFVLDTIVVINPLTTDQEICQDYSFDGVKITPDGSSTICARAQVSLPYVYDGTSTPEGYTVSYFYNDFDTLASECNQAHPLETPLVDRMWVPAIRDETGERYGIKNGGYYLDGLTYLSYSYSTDENYTRVDSVIYKHKLVAPYSQLPEVYRVDLDNVYKVTDQIASRSSFEYHIETGLPTQKKEHYANGDTIISIAKYACFDSLNGVLTAVALEMQEDNAISQVKSQTVVKVSSTNDTTKIGYQEQSYEKHGSWKPVGSVAYRDILDESTKYTTQEATGFDEFGNVLSSRNANGIRSNYKYSEMGDLSVSYATNCNYSEFLIQDFEQGETWDQWDCYEVAGLDFNDDQDVFTGKYSRKLIDDASSSYNNWGPKKSIPADSLSDTLYYFSCWVKTDQPIRIWCHVKDGSGQIVPGWENNYIRFDNLTSLEWQKIDGTFNLAQAVFDTISVQISMDNDVNGLATANFDNFRFHPLRSHVSTQVYNTLNSSVSEELDANNIPTRYEYDERFRVEKIRDYEGNLTQRNEYFINTDFPLQLNSPHYNVSIQYCENGDSTVTVSFFDALGRVIQTRSTNFVFNAAMGTFTEASLVTSVNEYDARGRVVRLYKPYYDLVGDADVLDFTPLEDVLTEANAYYCSTCEVDCQGKPYSEQTYIPDYKGRPYQSSGPGTDWDMASGHVTEFSYRTEFGNDTTVISTVIDPDGNTSVSVADQWGLFVEDTAYYTDRGTSVFMMTRYNNDYKGQLTSVKTAGVVDGETVEVVTREYQYNDLGQQSNTWRLDYGNIRIFYDKVGNVRFVQNDKRKNEEKFVYYKYDELGRMIEEGLCDTILGASSISTFSQSNADDCNFPDDSWEGNGKATQYKWVYDYVYDEVSQTAKVDYGQLELVHNMDSSYFREYHYFPFENKDSVVVKLLLDNGDNKAIVHEFDDISGRMTFLNIYPYSDGTNSRRIEYEYDLSGRLESIIDPNVSAPETREYLKNKYSAGGYIDSTYLGIYSSGEVGENTYCSQAIDYSYNARGWLTNINDINSVSTIMTGRGPDTSHFAQTLSYFSSLEGYYNGRILKNIGKVSDNDPSLTSNYYTYGYNELGWLTQANKLMDPDNSTEYWYNFMGNRDSVLIGMRPIDPNFHATWYEYSDVTGSSRLLGFDADTTLRAFDTLGNLLYGDGVNLMSYDYRNMLTFARLDRTYANGTHNTLDFWYNDSGMRILKKYLYHWRRLVGGGGIPIDSKGNGGGLDQPQIGNPSKYGTPSFGIKGIGGGGGGLPTYEYITDTTEWHYLYDDNNALLAIFDKSDNVEQLYVNNLAGSPVAVYKNNSSNQRYYFLKDHIGNTRAMVNDSGTVVEYTNYKPFGEILNSWMSYDEPLEFTGKERDKHGVFDFSYFGARYYDSKIGMFSTTDPAADKYPSYSLYAYANNNPLSFVDPNGEDYNSFNLFYTPREYFSAMWSNVFETPKWWARETLSGTSDFSTDFSQSFIDFGKNMWDDPSYGSKLAYGFMDEITDERFPDRFANSLCMQWNALTGEYGPRAQGYGLFSTAAMFIPVLGRTSKVASTRNIIGWTSAIGEDGLVYLGGKAQVFKRTSLGGRYIDRLAKEVGHEAKTGYKSLTKSFRMQIAKDAELIATQEIKGATWHFFRSPVTGKIGYSKPLGQALYNAGIKFKIEHLLK